VAAPPGLNLRPPAFAARRSDPLSYGRGLPPVSAKRYKPHKATCVSVEFRVQRRDKKARLRGLCGAKGYAIEELPGSWAYKLIQLDIGHPIWTAKRHCVAFNLDEAIYYLRFRAETPRTNHHSAQANSF
jgi:hypothetical protein